MSLARCAMKKLAVLCVALSVVGLSAQQPTPQRTVSDFFNDFTAEWMRANPNQAASSRYFTGAEQEAFEQQLSPETAEFRRARAAVAQKGLTELATFDRARMSETDHVSADLMQWQLEMVVDAEKFTDYVFPLEQFGGANVSLPNTLAVNHPLNTEKDAVHYITRLGLVSTRMDEAIADAQAHVAKHMIPPRF